jgi:hypothetical protein
MENLCSAAFILGWYFQVSRCRDQQKMKHLTIGHRAISTSLITCKSYLTIWARMYTPESIIVSVAIIYYSHSSLKARVQKDEAELAKLKITPKDIEKCFKVALISPLLLLAPRSWRGCSFNDKQLIRVCALLLYTTADKARSQDISELGQLNAKGSCAVPGCR